MSKIDLGQITDFTKIIYNTPNVGIILFNTETNTLTISLSFVGQVYSSGEEYYKIPPEYCPSKQVQSHVVGFTCTDLNGSNLEESTLQVIVETNGSIRVYGSKAFVYSPVIFTIINY